METVNERITHLVQEINDLTPGHCDQGCETSCRLAGLVASNIIFRGDYEIPAGSEGCDNFANLNVMVNAVKELVALDDSTTTE